MKQTDIIEKLSRLWLEQIEKVSMVNMSLLCRIYKTVLFISVFSEEDADINSELEISVGELYTVNSTNYPHRIQYIHVITHYSVNSSKYTVYSA